MSLDLAKRQLLIDYDINDRKSAWRVKIAFERLIAFFGRQCPLAQITGDRLLEYASHRLEKVQRGTVGYELKCLRSAMKLLRKVGKIPSLPPFPQLKDSDPRQGFFEDEEYRTILQVLPADIGALVTFLYWTGWRLREATNLKWAAIDLKLCLVRLEGTETKNEHARTFPYRGLPELKKSLDNQQAIRERIESNLGRVIPWVFFWYRSGAQMRNPRPTWTRACRRVGLPGKYLHDFRRTAVRRLERAGVPRQIAMRLTGHRSERIYTRYDIVNEADLSEGIDRLARYVQGSPRRNSADRDA